MGVDIHAYIECDFQQLEPPFTSPASVRCMNQGEFFIWRDIELFHALGLVRYQLDLPKPTLKLGRVPEIFSRALLEKQCVIKSANVARKTEDEPLPRYPASMVEQWKEDAGQCLAIKDHPGYELDLQEGEQLVLNPGCQLPNFATAKELRSAIEHCKISGQKVDFFLAIVTMMDGLGSALSPMHVRMIYWFDSMGADAVREHLVAD